MIPLRVLVSVTVAWMCKKCLEIIEIHSLKLTAKALENRQSQTEIHLPTTNFQVFSVRFRQISEASTVYALKFFLRA